MNGVENTSRDTADQLGNEIRHNLQNLLLEHPKDALLANLEDLYKRKFNNSIAVVLLELALPDLYSQLVSSTSENQENNSSSLAISQEQSDINKTQDQLLKKITASGVVPNDFRYKPNSLNFENGETFLAFVTNIDQNSHRIYLRPERYGNELTQALRMYYSDPISEQWIVEDVRPGFACVGKHEGIYHRMLVKESRPSTGTYLIVYIDLGLVKEVSRNEVQFKYLLNYFGSAESMVIACLLEGIEFKLHNYQMPAETYNQLWSLCRNGPFHIERCGQTGGDLSVKIYDADHHCLNDLLVHKNLAISCPPTLNRDDRHKDIPRSDNYSKQNSRPLSSLKPLQVITNQTNRDDRPSESVPFGDYDVETYKETSTNAPTSLSNANNDYEDSSPSVTSLPKVERKNGNTSVAVKSDGHASKQTRKNVKDRINQPESQSRQNDSHGAGFKITVRRDVSGPGRLFGLAWAGVADNKSGNQRRTNQPTERVVPASKDKFTEWICSPPGEKSLWSEQTYGKALLAYVGKICGQRMQMSQLLAQAQQQIPKLDDLDILQKLINKVKHEHDTQASLREWEDNSRINRRLTDLRFIFEFNVDSATGTHPFQVSPPGLTQIINRQTIKSYFDLGCGDGVITSAVGAYLGLTSERIFGGDVFVGQSDEITFVKIDENESTINLSSDHVDLITSFVTFHHIAQLEKTLCELTRILRLGGYLILREHDCKSDRSPPEKYLHFVHAIMMIARVGEFVNIPEKSESSWSDQKSQIIEFMKTIHYRTREEWQKKLKAVGFQLIATLSYGANGVKNPQHLFYAVYQLQSKPQVSEPFKEKTSTTLESENEFYL